MSADHKNHQVTRIVSELGARLGRFVRARVRTDEDAEDVLQDVWQRLITALDDGTVEQIGAWLYTVARNRIIDRARKPTMASLDATLEDADDVTFEFPLLLLRDDHTPRPNIDAIFSGHDCRQRSRNCRPSSVRCSSGMSWKDSRLTKSAR